MNGFRLRGNSIVKKMMVPMLIVLLIQVGVFLSTALGAGTVRQLNNNAFDILNERTINRKNDLENDMIQHWSNLDEAVAAINQMMHQRLAARGLTTNDVISHPEVANELLEAAAEQLVYVLRHQNVTDAFLVLNGQEPTYLPNEGHTSRPGLYLRDLDPETYPSDNSDLLIERAPPSVVKKLDIAMDTYWQAQFTFSVEQRERSNFFYYPLQAAVNFPGTNSRDLGYWCPSFRMSDNDRAIITYSVPLVGDRGIPYAVLGVGVSADYLRRLLPYTDLAQNKEGSYALTLTNDQRGFETMLSSGPLYKKLYGEKNSLFAYPGPQYGNAIFRFQSDPAISESVYGSVQYLQLYNSHTPFEEDRWALVGMMEGTSLLSFSNKVRTTLMLAATISLVLGSITVMLISVFSTKPIAALVRRVRASDPMQPVQFTRTNIWEIDELAQAVEHLSRNVADSASKLSQIVDLTSTPIGAFEYNASTRKVFCTGRLYDILGFGDKPAETYIDVLQFKERMVHLEQTSKDEDLCAENIHVYRISDQPGHPRWVRLKTVVGEERTLGVVEDITIEVLEKRKIEYERDYDLLTDLLNRRAFQTTMNSLFSKPECLGVAALVMMDLDNLKFMNDTFGHDLGDRYISCLARLLRQYAPPNAVVSRVSGDEFYVFIYGYDSKEEVRPLIAALRDGVYRADFLLPDQTVTHVRASAGVAWYPFDAQNSTDLIRYADFAMYKVKNTTKGGFTEFDADIYAQDAYLLQNREDFNLLVEKELVDYHFQPIVEVATGRVYAYEALMRSRVPSLRSPLEILNLARSQSKLYQIEHLTWFVALRSFFAQPAFQPDSLLFVNSISSQMLLQQDIEALEQLYKGQLHRIVLEITEEEKMNEAFAKHKYEVIVKRWGGMLALDDFGTGYNGETTLLTLHPHLVKADMSIVRDIDKDANRRSLLQNLVKYSHERGIRVIAEGVETLEEMQTLVQYDVDYLQGYYLGKPSPYPAEVPPDVVEQLRGSPRGQCGEAPAGEPGGW